MMKSTKSQKASVLYYSIDFCVLKGRFLFYFIYNEDLFH
jgi:hypothetical protein